MTAPVRTSQAISATFIMTLFFMLAAITSQPAHAQTYTVLHNFSNFPDGKYPYAGLTMDAGGDLYGTTSQGGDGFCNNGAGCGTVFKVKHTTHGWIVEVLQIFNGPNGFGPRGRLIFGPDGALYGTAAAGGQFGFGLIFRLTPPPTFCHAVSCPWIETHLYDFQGGTDGAGPESEVLFDASGNFYGTADYTAYKMTRSGTGWTYSVLHTFTGGQDGLNPIAGLTFDQAGNLYGTTWRGGAQDYGTVYKLIPSGGSWQESVLYSFGPFHSPYAGVILDQAGDLYGGTADDGQAGGFAYELSPVGGGWNFSTIYDLGNSVLANLTMDSAGNLYGTASGDFNNACGEVFELTLQGGTWIHTTLHSFQGSDGCEPASTVLMDASNHLFGTTMKGGTNNVGVVWEITR